MKSKDIEQQSRTALEECLGEIPFIQIDLEKVYLATDPAQPHLRGLLQTGNQVQKISVEINNSGEPRYARQAANKLYRIRSEDPDEYGIFIAPYITSGSANICREAGIGYIDFAGNCFLSFGQVYIKKEEKPNPFVQKRKLRSLYSPKSERILRVLLTKGPKDWKVKDLASKAKVSLGLVANVKQKLADQEWIINQRVGFSLEEPLPLLEEWSKNSNYRRNHLLNYYSPESPEFLERKLDEVCRRLNIDYGLTGFSGAARFAPTVRYRQIMAYIGENYENVISEMDIKPVTSGANVLLLVPYDNGVFFGSQSIDNTQVVSPIQIYLDLMSYRGRGQEAAEAILEQVIKRIWQVEMITEMN